MMRGFRVENLRHPNNDIQRNLGIARGDFDNLSHINKFGFSSTVGATFQTVWDGNNLYPWPTTTGTLTIASDAGSSEDDGAVITVQGLDADYNLQNEDLTIAGSAGTKTFSRIFRAFVKTPASGQTTNVGVISITHTTVVRAKILAGNGQTLMAIYTVPAGYRAYILQFKGSLEKAKETIFQGVARPFGGSFRVQGIYGSSGSPVDYNYPVPLAFPAKTDFEVRVKAGATTGASAIFDLILEKI